MTSEHEADSPSSSSLENRLLRQRARGLVSADEAFQELYREYARTVAAWLLVRTDASVADDLAQEVWLIFYARFRRWEFGTEMESSEARPVLSFLFRTSHFVAKAHRRLASTRLNQPLEESETGVTAAAAATVQDGQEVVLRELEASRALEMAARICPEEEVDVLLAKLSGMSAREIGESLSITESVVDHRYRNALSKLRKALKVDKRRGDKA